MLSSGRRSVATSVRSQLTLISLSRRYVSPVVRIPQFRGTAVTATAALSTSASPTLRVHDVLSAKRKIKYTIDENASLDEAISHLVTENSSSSLAVGSQGEITGIFTARDLLRTMHKIHTASSSSSVAHKMRLSTKVKDIMATREKLVYCSPLDSVRKCREIMFQVKIRNIPVIESGSCLGIINIKDLADSSISITESGGKKGFIHNISGRRGLPLGTQIALDSDDERAAAQLHIQRVREVSAASYALPHPFKNSESGVRVKYLEHCTDLSLSEGEYFCCLADNNT
jgi:CBS domain-containing protein